MKVHLDELNKKIDNAFSNLESLSIKLTPVCRQEKTVGAFANAPPKEEDNSELSKIVLAQIEAMYGLCDKMNSLLSRIDL
jgi:hypothetical protein